MPKVSVTGMLPIFFKLPKGMHEADFYRKVRNALCMCVASVRELDIELKQSDVIFIQEIDSSINPDKNVVVVEVSRLYTKKERTKAVCDELADIIRDIMKTYLQFLNGIEKIEVFIDLFDRENNSYAVFDATADID